MLSVLQGILSYLSKDTLGDLENNQGSGGGIMRKLFLSTALLLLCCGVCLGTPAASAAAAKKPTVAVVLLGWQAHAEAVVGEREVEEIEPVARVVAVAVE